jgi:hypothetical protein
VEKRESGRQMKKTERQRNMYSIQKKRNFNSVLQNLERKWGLFLLAATWVDLSPIKAGSIATILTKIIPPTYMRTLDDFIHSTRTLYGKVFLAMFNKLALKFDGSSSYKRSVKITTCIRSFNT